MLLRNAYKNIKWEEIKLNDNRKLYLVKILSDPRSLGNPVEEIYEEN